MTLAEPFDPDAFKAAQRTDLRVAAPGAASGASARFAERVTSAALGDSLEAVCAVVTDSQLRAFGAP